MKDMYPKGFLPPAAMPLEKIWDDASFSSCCKGYEMKLFGAGLDDRHMPALVAFLQKRPDITVLNISANLLSDRGAILLANVRLKEIDISRNDIRDEGVCALLNNNTLTKVVLSDDDQISAERREQLKKLGDVNVFQERYLRVAQESVGTLLPVAVVTDIVMGYVDRGFPLKTAEELSNLGFFSPPVISNDPASKISAAIPPALSGYSSQ